MYLLKIEDIYSRLADMSFLVLVSIKTNSTTALKLVVFLTSACFRLFENRVQERCLNLIETKQKDGEKSCRFRRTRILCSSSYIFRFIRSVNMGRDARIRGMRNTYEILVGNLEWNISLEANLRR